VPPSTPAVRQRRKLSAVIKCVLAGGAAICSLVLTAGVGQAAHLPVRTAPVFAAGAEQITGYQVELDVKRDGSLHVRETIDYDFGGLRRHGIVRKIPVELRYDAKRNREYPIDHVKVSSPTGAPVDLETRKTDTVETFRIGDPVKEVTGNQTYVIDYDVRAVVNSFADRQELYWNAIGVEWEVPVLQARATVRGPAAVQKVWCFQGPKGSKDACPAKIAGAGTASFSSGPLKPGEGMTVVAAFPPGTFVNSNPILVQKPTLMHRAGSWLGHLFAVTPGKAVGSIGLIGFVAGLGFVRVIRPGRDEQFLGVTPGLMPGYGQDQRVGPVPHRGNGPVAVRFTPPDGMHPAPFGVLLEGRADVTKVTATIIDLAVRGFLLIEEVGQADRAGKASARDWKLIAKPGAPTGALMDYETLLLETIFANRSEVLISDLKLTFRKALQLTRSTLYNGVTRAGWFKRNPGQGRAPWSIAGLILFVVSAFKIVTAFGHDTSAVFAIALMITAFLLIWIGQKPPARTATGTALLIQARGFKLYLEKAEADQIRLEERADIFSRYLPFAIVLGVADRWAKVFAALAASGASLDSPGWYVGPGSPDGGFDFAAFGASIAGFSSAAADSLATTSSGSGAGGSSGGGGGGGGGGSW